jgi:hypothetical protein
MRAERACPRDGWNAPRKFTTIVGGETTSRVPCLAETKQEAPP